MLQTVEPRTRRRLLGLAAVLAAPAALLGWQVETGGPVTDLDHDGARAFDELAREQSWLAEAAEVLTWFGRFPFLAWVAIGAAVVLGSRGRTRAAVTVLAATAGGQLLNIGLKEWVGRPRPVPDDPVFTAAGFSFPSGHAMVTTVVVGAVLVGLLPMVARHRRRAIVLGSLVFVGAMGATRLVLGVHYLSDVLAGHLLGASWVALVVALTGAWRPGRP